MVIALLVILLIISSAAFIAACVIIQRLLQKIDTYEEWILDFKTDLVDTLEEMRALDRGATFKSSFTSTGLGAFESDDQVSAVFKGLLELIEKLNSRTQ